MRVRLYLAAALAFTACDSDDDKAGETADTAQIEAALQTYARIVQATYADSITAAVALEAAVDALAADPSEATLAAARTQWIAAREPYLQSEVFRFYEGPIDEPEGLLNAWPMDEAFVDSVADAPASGIINDPARSIDAASLEALNEQGGEKNIATGYHAVEFLLWGQDLSADGPGDRPHTDFLMGAEATLPNGDRRAQYLTVTTEMIIEHLKGVEAAWADGADNYRREFLAATPEDGLRRALTGMIILSGFETGGERLQTALDSGDQEDEHSCFSDNTHRDMVQDVRGVQNVYLGRYTGIDGRVVEGAGIKAAVDALDADLGARLAAEIADSLAKAEALQPPFDREIALGNPAGRARVEALITALRTQEKSLEEVFRKFDLDVPVAE